MTAKAAAFLPLLSVFVCNLRSRAGIESSAASLIFPDRNFNIAVFPKDASKHAYNFLRACKDLEKFKFIQGGKTVSAWRFKDSETNGTMRLVRTVGS